MRKPSDPSSQTKNAAAALVVWGLLDLMGVLALLAGIMFFTQNGPPFGLFPNSGAQAIACMGAGLLLMVVAGANLLRGMLKGRDSI